MSDTSCNMEEPLPTFTEWKNAWGELAGVYGKQSRRVRRRVTKFMKKHSETLVDAVEELAWEFTEPVPESSVSDSDDDATSSSSCSPRRRKSFDSPKMRNLRKNCVQLHKPPHLSKEQKKEQEELAVGVTESLFMSLAPMLATAANPAGAMMAIGPLGMPTAFCAPHFKIASASAASPTMQVAVEQTLQNAQEGEEENAEGAQPKAPNPPMTPQQAAAAQAQMQAMVRSGMQMPPQMRSAPPGLQVGNPGGGEQAEDRFADLMFPGFDGSSFIWKISMAQCAQFVLSMIVGQTRAAPNTCSLYLLGASWGPSIASGQLWRLILPTMLHANMMHLFFNIFFQLRIGFGMEKQFGVGKFVLLYFICGIVGNLISVAIDPYKLAVGASTSGFGLIGVWLAEILLSWHIMGPHREKSILWILFMLFSVVMMSSVAPNIDIWGHIGGAMAGFLVAVIISDMSDEHRPTWYKTAKRAAALGLFAVLLITGIKIFMFTPRVPIPACGSMLMHSWFRAWA